MPEPAVPREPGEDLVAWRNRCLDAEGRHDVRWRWNKGGGGMHLEHRRHASKLEDKLL